MLKIVHAADLHIDSPLRGLDRYEGAPVERLRAATRRALENLVALCIAEQTDVLLLAGDVFDGSWKDYSTGLFFLSQMVRLRDAKIPVVMVRGNHDALSSVARALRLPDNVRVLDDRQPETFELPNSGRHDIAVAIHGQSFTQRVTTEDLAARYPDRIAGQFNIGLLHTSLDGREGHAPYAPTSLETMRAKGYDYWALGHVHAREVVSTDPYVVYPGNIQGRHAKETGSKGATLVTVGAGSAVQSIEHRPLDVVRWAALKVDVSSAADTTEVADLVRRQLLLAADQAEDRVLAARVVITGSTRANNAIRRDTDRFINELRAMATDGLGDGVWLEKVLVETRSVIDITRIREENSAVGHLARRLASIKDDPKELAELATIFAELDKRLPVELREGEGALHLGEATTLRAIVEDVEQMLVPRLLEGGGEG